MKEPAQGNKKREEERQKENQECVVSCKPCFYTDQRFKTEGAINDVGETGENYWNDVLEFEEKCRCAQI